MRRSFVYKVENLRAESKDLKRRPGSGRPKTVNSKAIKDRLKKDPAKSMSTVAKELGIHKSTVAKEVKKMGGKSLRLVERPLLSQKHRDTRVERSKNF
jgi:AraC-like DNA-binding protein